MKATIHLLVAITFAVSLNSCAFFSRLVGKESTSTTTSMEVTTERSITPKEITPDKKNVSKDELANKEAAKPLEMVTYPVAMAVPGKPGFVFSPYNNRIVDVAGFASGLLVSDPHFPTCKKKYFRVP